MQAVGAPAVRVSTLRGEGQDDVPAEGEAVHDGGAEPRVGERLRPATERLVGGDRDAVLLLPLGQNLEQQFSAPAVQLHVAGFVDAQKINTAVAADGLGQLLVVRGLHQLIDDERRLGLQEWDLASTAVAVDTFGTMPPEAYDGFCRAYGSDIPLWYGYVIMRSVRELRLVTAQWDGELQYSRPAAAIGLTDLVGAEPVSFSLCVVVYRLTGIGN